MCQYQIVATFHHSLEKSSVSITDGTGALDVTIAHSAMEQLFDYAFPIKNVLKMKKELKEGFPRKKIELFKITMRTTYPKERNHKCQKNIHNYFGPVTLIKENGAWKLTNFGSLRSIH